MTSISNRFDKVIVLESVRNHFFQLDGITTNSDEFYDWKKIHTPVRKQCFLKYVWVESDLTDSTTKKEPPLLNPLGWPWE